jgi:predicted ATPase
MHEAELWRLRGELLLQHNDSADEAERSFRRSYQVAQAQQARSWALRTTTSLARLLCTQNRHDEAKSYLAPSLAAFSEGFENADLKQAAALLHELG